MSSPLVEAINISKSFRNVLALDGVNLKVPFGTFHAVIGENGAGKSTLAKCITGFYQPDSGEVRVGGTRVITPTETREKGVGMVFQHFTLIPSMTVAENLVLPRLDLPATLNWREELKRLKLFLEEAPFSIDLESRVAHLAAGQKQKVEILKQLYLSTKVLILDEPTSVLTPAESNEVMSVLSSMVRRNQISVILITHKLREVMNFADDVTILRRGRLVATTRVSDTTATGLAELMMGERRSLKPVVKEALRSGAPALELRQLTVRNDVGLTAVKNVSLTVGTGEIVGIAGISGNGQRELVQAIGGQRAIEAGEILAFGSPFQPTREGIRKAGLLTLPEEPLQNAVVSSMSVAENLALRTFDKLAGAGWFLNPKSFSESAVGAIRKFSIRPADPDAPIRNLSGGNVQRTVLARDLGDDHTKIMVTANPCFGLDFAATEFVHDHLLELRNKGGSVLLVSEDLDELIKLCDRILVMSEGVIVHETVSANVDLAAIGSYMGGQAGMEPVHAKTVGSAV